MEQKLNIAKILKNKPRGTKLYSMIHGKCSFEAVTDEIFKINFCTSKFDLTQSGECTLIKFGNMYDGGECIIFPSKEMRDWRKFAWKKGDLLINSCGFQCIFKEWASDDYTKFNGCYSTSRDGYEDVSNAETANFVKLDNNTTYEYIKEIERKLGGKLNLKTLEIEKQLEFKDGDIVCISGMGYLAYGIVKSIDNSSKKLEYYVLNDMSTLKFEDWLSFEDKQIQPITETQQIILFDALARENKAWDAEKIQIVDLKPKVKLKPFDKVIVRCSKADKWSIDFFSYKVSNGYICTGDAWFGYCLPYNEETAKLIGTTNNVENQV